MYIAVTYCKLLCFFPVAGCLHIVKLQVSVQRLETGRTVMIHRKLEKSDDDEIGMNSFENCSFKWSVAMEPRQAAKTVKNHLQQCGQDQRNQFR